MKLKKIVSLALAGVLAVSMLAGCNKGGSGSSSSETPVNNDLTSKVIAELDKDITKKVSFTADSNLQSALDKMIAYYGYNSTDLATNFTATNLANFDPNLETDLLPALDTASNAVDKDDDKQTTTVVVTMDTSDSNLTYVAKALAGEIAGEDVMSGSIKADALPSKGSDVKSSSTASAADCYYTFEYTGNMAVQVVDDSVGNVTGYVVAFTITRTSTKVDL